MDAELSRDDAQFVRELLYRRSAILLDDSKAYLISTRLAQLAKETGFSTIGALVGDARKGLSRLETKIVEALTTHETLFFRDLHPFELLRKHLLPALISKRGVTRKLTIWSAACSSGQEPYSLAMLLLEHFREVAKWPVRIIATDLSAQVLARAKEGRFRQMEVNRGLPAAMMVKYFDRADGDFVLKPEVRSMVEFRQLNLLDPWSLGVTPDVVFIRNVLIYFDLQRKRDILKRVRETIAPDGGLFLGAAETTFNVDEGWDRVGVEKSSYYRVHR